MRRELRNEENIYVQYIYIPMYRKLFFHRHLRSLSFHLIFSFQFSFKCCGKVLIPFSSYLF